jgi:hypothetical protein
MPLTGSSPGAEAFNLSAGWRNTQTIRTKKLNHSALALSRGNFLLLHSTFVRLYHTTLPADSAMVRPPAVSLPGVHPVNEDSTVLEEALRLDVVADRIAGTRRALAGNGLLTAVGVARHLVRESEGHDDNVIPVVVCDEEEK